MDLLKISSPDEEGVLQVSKSLKFPVLLDDSEMCALMTALGKFYIGVVSEPLPLNDLLVEKKVFLEAYKEYVEMLKRGEIPSFAFLRRYFSGVISADLDAFYAMDVGKGRFLLKSIQPVIQMQIHHFLYSPVDEKFHSLVLGGESVSWGIQFSYPQVAQDPKTKAIAKISADMPNSRLFATLSRWIREVTRPTPFIVGEKLSHEPIRIGKECFSWIAEHPQLKMRGIQIRGAYGN
jgi:hypothetical protein